MNKAILMGRLTKDPDFKTTRNGTAVCSFTLAVERRFKLVQGEADFIPCVAWRQTAEFVDRYFSKGQRMALVGSIQVSSWDDDDGKRQYKTEVIADEVYFAESKKKSNDGQPASDDGYFPADDGGALPFDL